MSDVTQILSRLESGDPSASNELFLLVYEELRKLAAARLAHEKPGQTLQATALVNETYLRLLGNEVSQQWQGRAHFFAAAAEAMRRILVEAARSKSRVKRGGECQRVDFNEDVISDHRHDEELLAVNDLLDELSSKDPGAAEVVKLRYFAAYSLDEIADLLGISKSTVQRRWNFARAWLFAQLSAERG